MVTRQSRQDRQRATAEMNHCGCGNIAKLGATLCGACENQQYVRIELVECETVEDLKAFIAAHLMDA